MMPQPVRVTGESTLGLVERWCVQVGTRAGGNIGSPPSFRIAGDKVILHYLDDEPRSWPGDFFVVALDIETGQVVWQTRVTPEHDKWVESSHLDGERLYLVYDYAAHAFDLETGAHLWSTFDPEHRPGTDVFYTFRPWDPTDPLLWHSTDDEVIALDPRTGNILHRQPEGSWWQHIQRDQVDFETTREELRVVDLQTREVLWTHSSLGDMTRIRYWPAFVEDDIVFYAGRVCYVVARADVRTGQIVWSTSAWDYLSNFAIAGSKVYALREDLTLVAFDLETGVIVGTLKFDGPPAETVCGEGPYVAVYFGDTDEVIMFEEQPAP